MAKINQYTPSVLGWVADPSLQAHRYGCCNEDHEWDSLVMPVPYGTMPTMQFMLSRSTTTFQEFVDDLSSGDTVFDLKVCKTEAGTWIESETDLDVYISGITSGAIDNSLHAFIAVPYELPSSIDEKGFFAHVHFNPNYEAEFECGHYYHFKMGFEGEKPYYSNTFKVVPKSCCLHTFEFWNDCDRDGLFAKSLVDEGGSEPKAIDLRNRLYIDGCNVMKPEEKVKEKRTLLLNGCYRTDQYEIFEMFRIKVPKAFYNIRRAARWMGGFDNITLYTANGLISNIQNIVIENVKAIGKRQCFDSFDILFEDCYLNPAACCYDYSLKVEPEDGAEEQEVVPSYTEFEQVPLPMNPFSDCGEACYLNSINVETCGVDFASISYYSSTLEIDYRWYEISASPGGWTTTSDNPISLTGLAENATFIIELSNECGATTFIEFETKSCALEVTLEWFNKTCEAEGYVSYDVDGVQGALELTFTDTTTSDVYTTSSPTGSMILPPGTYDVEALDDFCLVSPVIPSFEIEDDCLCFFNINLYREDCTCDTEASLTIVVDPIVSGGAFDIFVEIAGNPVITIPSTSLDASNSITITADGAGNPLLPDTYDVYIIDDPSGEACEWNVGDSITINNDCECDPPILIDVTDFDSSSITLQWNKVTREDDSDPSNLYFDNYCIEYGDIATATPITIDVSSPSAIGILSHTIEGLACGTTYYFKVKTKCDSDVKTIESDWSELVYRDTTECTPQCEDDDLFFNSFTDPMGANCITATQVNTDMGTISWSTDGVNYTVGDTICPDDCTLLVGNAGLTSFDVSHDPGTNTQVMDLVFDQNLTLAEAFSIILCSDVIMLEYTAQAGQVKYFALYNTTTPLGYVFGFGLGSFTKTTDFNLNEPACEIPYAESVEENYSDANGSVNIYCCSCPLKYYFKLERPDCPDVLKCVEILPNGELVVSDIDLCDIVEVNIEGTYIDGETCIEVTLTNEPPDTEIQTSLDNSVWTYENPICLNESDYCTIIYQSECPISTNAQYFVFDNPDDYLFVFTNVDDFPPDIVPTLESCTEIIQIDFVDENGNPIRLNLDPSKTSSGLFGTALLIEYAKGAITHDCEEMLLDTEVLLTNLATTAGAGPDADCIRISCCTCPQEIYVRVVFDIDCPTICKHVIVQDINNFEIIDLVCDDDPFGF